MTEDDCIQETLFPFDWNSLVVNEDMETDYPTRVLLTVTTLAYEKAIEARL